MGHVQGTLARLTYRRDLVRASMPCDAFLEVFLFPLGKSHRWSQLIEAGGILDGIYESSNLSDSTEAQKDMH